MKIFQIFGHLQYISDQGIEGILRFEMSQRQEVMATNLKKMTLGILRFEMSQRQEVMATSLKKMTLGILKFEMSQRKEVMAFSLKNRL